MSVNLRGLAAADPRESLVEAGDSVAPCLFKAAATYFRDRCFADCGGVAYTTALYKHEAIADLG
jgi:hypothetical protein